MSRDNLTLFEVVFSHAASALMTSTDGRASSPELDAFSGRPGTPRPARRMPQEAHPALPATWAAVALRRHSAALLAILRTMCAGGTARPMGGGETRGGNSVPGSNLPYEVPLINAVETE